MIEVGLILLAVFLCLGAIAVAGAGLVGLGRVGRRKGYRGPFLLAGLSALSIATLFVGLFIVVVPGRIPDEALALVGTFLGLVTFTLVLSALVVWLLPRRPERVAGPRRAAFPFALLGNLLMLGGLTILVSPLFTGWDLGLAVQSAVPLFLLSGLCAQMARRQRTPQAEEPADLDVAEDAVLLLRGFRDERALFAQTDARHQRRGIGRLVRAYFADNDDEFLTAEGYLGPAIAEALGPLVGLGNPSDYLPPTEGSALRYYALDSMWQAEMWRLIPRVSGFLVLVGRFTKSLAWELDYIRDQNAQERMILVTSPYTSSRGPWAGGAPLRMRLANRVLGVRPMSWKSLVSEMGAHGYQLPVEHPGAGSVIGFDGRGNAVVLMTGATTACEYATAIAARLRPCDRQPM